MKSTLIVLMLIFSSLSAYTQSIEFGLNAGIVASRYSVSKNFLGNDTWLRQGSIDYANRFGFQIALKEMPDKYKSLNQSFKNGLMMEISSCRCGGNTEIATKLSNGDFSVLKLNYITWQTDLSLLYQAKFNKTEFLIGPTLAYYTYRGVNYGNTNDAEYVYTQGQINKYYIGFDVGLGYRIDDFLISSRYHTNATAFGKASNTVPAEYGHHQFRLIVSYFLWERRLKSFHRGLYY